MSVRSSGTGYGKRSKRTPPRPAVFVTEAGGYKLVP